LTFLVAASNSSSLNDVEPGVLGFLVVAGLGVALVFLLRSMNKQFRKIGPPPEETDPDEPAEAAGQRPLRGLAAHRAAMRTAEAGARSAAEPPGAKRD
jgi:hypothetical protein